MTTIDGGATLGYWAIGNCLIETPPITRMKSAITHAKIGRSMKNWAMTGQRGAEAAEAAAPPGALLAPLAATVADAVRRERVLAAIGVIRAVTLLAAGAVLALDGPVAATFGLVTLATVAQMLIAEGVPVTLVDTDIEMIDVASEFGAKVYYGDGTRLDLLRQAGASEAELLLFCIDGDQIDADILEGVHAAFPNATIFVRAYDRRALIKLSHSKAEYVVREVLESAISMGRLL